MPADPRRLKDLFAAAADLPDPAARRDLLDRECPDDPDLRRRVEQLLRAHDQPASALEHPLGFPSDPGTRGCAPDDATVDRPAAPTAAVGDRVGPYKLLEKIGEGGMGDVWVADQTEPLKRRVAVKLIKPGMDSRSVLGRFEAERQALAVMDHPNIARVLDAGTTTDGRPYFVMELVKGTPITEFCDVRRLSPKERLELFVPVCQAIQHAHMKGIIHRDIKPSNVLVELYDDKAVAKVIDFGVAKAVGQRLTEKTIYTGFGALVGTPTYMAPEQATFNALDVDTRADVYALGVLLYELLAGSPPIEKERLKRAALDEVLRLVREEEPPRPSQRLSTADTRASIAAVRGTEPAKLSALMKGELDWIVMKALEKDRTRRYDSANGFAADVQRYLSGEQVQAVPPSLGYRVGKAYRRHKAVVLTGGLVALVLLLGIVGTTWGLVWAVGAEQQAKTDRDAAVQAQGEAAANEATARTEATNAKVAKEQQAADRYLSDMQLIPIPFQAGSTAEVNKLLQRHTPRPGEPDRRGFEWHYWNRQQNQQVLTGRLPDCEDNTNDAWKVSDDGRRIARLVSRTTAEDRPVLTVWDRATRRVVLRYPLPITPPGEGQGFSSPAAFAPQFSPDGRRVVVEWSYSLTVMGGPGSAFAGGGAVPTRQGSRVRQVIDVDTGKMLLDLSDRAPSNRWSNTRSGFSFDGRRFGHVSWDTSFEGDRPRSELLVWDLETGTAIPTAAEFKRCSRMAFHPDGETCVTASPVETPAALAAVTGGGGVTVLPTTRLALRDVRTGVARWSRLVPWGSLINLTVSPDGLLIAGTPERTGGTASVSVWEASTGREVSSCPIPEQGFGPRVNDLAFSPNGSRVAITWSTTMTGRSPVRGGLVTSGGSSNRLTILDPRTGTPFPPIDGWSEAQSPPAFRPQQVAYSPDGKQAYLPGDSTLRTWEVRTGFALQSFRGPVDPPGACGFTADGTRLWSAERDGAYKEWDLRPFRLLAIEFEGGNTRVTPDFAVSGDGGRFAHLVRTRYLGDDAAEFAVRIRDANGNLGKLLSPPLREVGPKPFTYQSRCGLALDRDGRNVLLTRREFKTRGLSGGGLIGGDPVGELPPADPEPGLPPPDLTVWDTSTGQRLFHQSIEQQLMPSPGGDGFVAVLSPDGRNVAVGVEPAKEGDPVRVRVFDVETGRERTPLTVAGATTLFTLAYSPDGNRLAAVAALYDKDKNRLSARLVVWEPHGGEPTVAAELFRDAKVSALGYASTFRAGVVWTPDGSRLVVSHGRPLNAGFAVHDAATGEPVVTLERPVNRSGLFPTGVVCSPDGKRVAAFLSTGGNEQPAVKMWDVVIGKEVLTLRKQQVTERRLGGPPRSKDRQLAFTADGHRLLGWEFGEVPEWSPETGTVMVPAYNRSVWDASPPPEAKK